MEGTENQSVKSKHEQLLEKLKGRYPDKTFESDDDWSGQISDDYDNFDKELSGYKEREGKIVGLMKKDKMAGKFMNDWMNDGDPRVGLMRSYGKEGIMAAFDDPEIMDKMAEADRQFVEQTANEEALVEEYKQNLAQSCEDLDKFAQEEGIPDEEIDKASQYLRDAAKDVIMGKFTVEAIKGALKAMNYEKDMESAAYEAEVRGKNQRMEQPLRKPKGDGMPTLGGGNAGVGAGQQRQMPGALGQQKKSIFERGGFKRMK